MTALPPRAAVDLEREWRRLGLELSPALVGALVAHYDAMRRYSEGASLVGPAAAEEVAARHYGEALAASSLLPRGGRLLDLGSGAGFPGLVLAAAAPGLEVHLVEPALKKAAFLRVAARRMGVGAVVHAVPLEALPAGVDEVAVVTSRALRLTPEMVASLLPRLRSDVRVLLWVGAQAPEFPGFVVLAERPLGGDRRRLLVLGRPEVSA